MRRLGHGLRILNAGQQVRQPLFGISVPGVRARAQLFDRLLVAPVEQQPNEHDSGGIVAVLGVRAQGVEVRREQLVARRHVAAGRSRDHLVVGRLHRLRLYPQRGARIRWIGRG